MKQLEAKEILGLKESSKGESIPKNYKEKYLQACLQSNNSADKKIMAERLRMLNKAYMTLYVDSETVPVNDPGFFLNLGTDLSKFNPTQPANFDVFPEFQKLIDKAAKLTDKNKHGLAIRLLEIGIERSFKLNRYKAFTGQKALIRTLGNLLLEIGLKDKGVELMTAGSINYYIGKTYYEIKDYRAAIKYFGRELQDKKAKVSSVDIVLNIVKCYFLLGEYANCLHIIERVLPNFESTKKRDWELPQKMSKILLFAISKVENLNKGLLVKFKLKLKYPVSYRCISLHIETFKDGLEFLDEIKEQDTFDKFYKCIEPEFHIVSDVNMNYTEEELNEAYYQVFSEPLNTSQLYNKR